MLPDPIMNSSPLFYPSALPLNPQKGRENGINHPLLFNIGEILMENNSKKMCVLLNQYNFIVSQFDAMKINNAKFQFCF